MDKQKTRVAIYCRVSTHEQSTGDFSSLDSQEATLKKYCSQRDWIVYKVYRDVKSGSTLDRDEMNNLLLDAEKGKFDVIAITKLDRISRTTVDFLRLVEKLQRLNISVAVSTQDINPTTPGGKAMRDMMMVFAEFERNMIADRTREKRFSQAQQGRWPGGYVPLGYNVVDKQLIVNENEAKIVKMIFEWYLREPSTYKIASKLNDGGFRTKVRTTKTGKTTGGGPYTDQHVLKILNSSYYIGKITFDDKLFDGIHKAIISEALFQQVQEELEKSKRYTKETYDASELILLGLTKCGFCGNYLTSTYGKGRQGERYYYYKCTKKSKQGSHQCEMSDIPAEKLEKFIEDIVVHIGSDDHFFNAVFDQMSANENIELKELRESLSAQRKNRGEIEKSINKLVDFVAQAPAGTPLQSLHERLQSLEDQRHDLTEKIVQLERDLEIIETYDLSKSRLREKYSSLSETYTALPRAMKRNVTKSIIAGIECSLKKKESRGKLKLAFRGDGEVEMDFFKKQKAETDVSTFHLPWLRG